MIEFHKKWITNSCLIIKENYQKINMLDQEIGDGDQIRATTADPEAAAMRGGR